MTAIGVRGWSRMAARMLFHPSSSQEGSERLAGVLKRRMKRAHRDVELARHPCGVEVVVAQVCLQVGADRP